MDNKEEKLKQLYDDALYMHLLHTGHNMRRGKLKIFYKRQGLIKLKLKSL